LSPHCGVPAAVDEVGAVLVRLEGAAGARFPLSFHLRRGVGGDVTFKGVARTAEPSLPLEPGMEGWGQGERSTVTALTGTAAEWHLTSLAFQRPVPNPLFIRRHPGCPVGSGR